MTTEPLVLHEKDARGAVTLTLNRPQAFNALYEAMLGALQSALDRRRRGEAVRGVPGRRQGLFPPNTQTLNGDAPR